MTLTYMGALFRANIETRSDVLSRKAARESADLLRIACPSRAGMPGRRDLRGSPVMLVTLAPALPGRIVGGPIPTARLLIGPFRAASSAGPKLADHGRRTYPH